MTNFILSMQLRMFKNLVKISGNVYNGITEKMGGHGRSMRR